MKKIKKRNGSGISELPDTLLFFGSSLFLMDKMLFNLPALVFVMISTRNSGEPIF
jgi:hypothetical protein